MGDSLAVELPALDRAALVRIQVPQPQVFMILHIFHSHFFYLPVLILAISMIVTKFMIQLSITAHPLQRSSHSIPTPSAGGVGFIVAFLIGFFALIVFSFTDPTLRLFYRPIGIYGVCVLLLGGVSFWDDWKTLSHRYRLAVHCICALLIVWSGFTIQFPGLPVPYGFACLISFFAIISLINAANFIDGLNGLLAGSVLLCLVFNSFLLISGSPNIIYVNILLSSALLGFLIYNFPKAKVFMGDVGSTFLGLTCAFLALLSQNYYPVYYAQHAWVHKAFIFTLTPLSFLWFDVAFTLFRRAMRGCNLAEAHRDHLIHILNDCGYSHPFVSGLYFMSAFMMGCLTQLCHHGILTFVQFALIYAFMQGTFVIWVFYTQKTKNKP